MNDVADQEQSLATPSFRVFTCGPFRIEQWQQVMGWQAVPKQIWGRNHPPRLLLKLLLCQPQRSAVRSLLLKALWPDYLPKEAHSLLTNTASVLRSALKPAETEASLLLDTEDHSRYGLAGQDLLWVDADAALAVLQEAETLEQAGDDPLPLLEEAAALLKRGTFLEGEEHALVRGRRATVTRAWRGCRLWQARLSQQREQWSQAQPVLDGLLEEDPNDEDALCSLMQFLQARGRPSEALRLYEQLVERLAEQGKQPLETTRQVADHLRSALPPMPLSLPPHASSSLVLVPKELPSLPVVTQGILRKTQENREPEGRDMDRIRRQLLALGMTGTTLVMPYHDVFDLDVLERIVKALKRPSHVDNTVLTDLETITSNNRQRFVRARESGVILSDISDHLHTLSRLLEHSLSTDAYRRLCTLAGETAQLIGDILFNAGDSDTAETYYQVALETAEQAHNDVLYAVILGRKSFIPIYRDNGQAHNHAQDALPLLEEARRRAVHCASDTIIAWLWAIEAEAQAHIQAVDACFRALAQSESHLERRHCGAVSSTFADEIHSPFSSSHLLGYKGVCNVRLQRSDAAQLFLHERLASMDAARVHKKSITLTDLAMTYIQLGEVEEACKYAIQALSILEQTGSARVFQRILHLRRELTLWRYTASVKDLDRHILSVRSSLPH